MQPNNPQRPVQAASSRPQFFDVVRPGRTPASPNARPVLPNNRPAVPDTSMKMGAPAVPSSLINKLASPAPVSPPTRPVAPSAPIAARPAPLPPTPRTFPTQPIQQQLTQPSQPATASAEPTVDRPQPTHQQKHSIWSEVLAVLAILLLVAIIINILLDAEIIDLPLPHTNFFDY